MTQQQTDDARESAAAPDGDPQGEAAVPIEAADDAEQPTGPEAEMAALVEERDNYLAGWQRAQAELDNYRKRMEREQQRWNERILRDVRVCKIYEGTSDIQRLIIGRDIAAT